MAAVVDYVCVRRSPETSAGEGPDDDAERLVEKVDTLGSKVDTSLRELGVDVDEGDGMLDGFKAFSRIICTARTRIRTTRPGFFPRRRCGATT